jgi:hypothetical protein
MKHSRDRPARSRIVSRKLADNTVTTTEDQALANAMLSKLVSFEDKIALIQNTGVQFLDFGLKLALRKELPGEFVSQESNRSLARLEYDGRNDRHYHPQRPGVAVKSRLTVPMDESAKLFDGLWFPIPVLRLNPPRQFAQGPETWARARLVALSPEEADLEEETHRLTLALDTCVFAEAEDLKYLAPTVTDVRSGVSFAFAHRADEIGWFPEQPWVSGWVEEVYDDRAGPALRLPPEDVDAEKERLAHHAHYLNMLALIGDKVRLPEVKLLSNAEGDLHGAIPVDMVLDVGNSRTCGILIEDHPKDKDGLSRRYELELRDLSRPHRVWSEPFESRVEFAQAAFGKEHWAHKSGRAGAFLWPTIARVGPEAARLAARRRGTEGATGISSPKRYLWDEERFDTGWRFNSAYVRTEIEPRATAAPFCNLINELGHALFELPEEERMPVFAPHYARSSTMMFMLAEVLTQAQCQINSAAQRLRMPNADLPRHLRSIILTIPPSMPKPEREIFAGRVHQALGLVWKAFGWHPEDDPIDGEGAELAWPPFPQVEVRWDEATCGQVVYLYSESQNGFAGRPDELFAMARQSPATEGPLRLTLATVDIGGGTTDLVVNDYVLDESGSGANAYIVPEQRFRDGFKVAGDDILLDIIRAVLVPALSQALTDAGVDQPTALLSRLIGFDHVDVQEGVLRQQLALQVLYPAGLALLKHYEQYDPVTGAETRAISFAELLSDMDADPPTQSVLKYFADGVRGETGTSVTEPFDLMSVPVSMELGQMHRLFMEDKLEITRSIRSLCEIIHLYNCDVLLLTGRPSRLPGIQSLFRALLPLPPDRIVPLQGYRTGTWYPFNRQGCIQDPKTTAAVGAMLCVLGQGRLPNFFFRAKAFQPYSTVRYLGLMDHRMIIKDDSVFYRDVDLDDPDYELPDESFPMLGIMRIGYRQLDAERWGASPLYVLDFADKEACERLYRDGGILRVRLERVRGAATERLRVAGVDVEGGRSMGRGVVALKLNTLAGGGPDEDSYWVDSGSVYR